MAAALRLLRLCAVALCLTLPVLSVPVGPTAAQTAPSAEAIDFDIWEAEATRAERLIEARRASTAFFENTRAALVDWRARFLAVLDENDARIATIEAQLQALGPEPETGAAEPRAVADRRAQLTEQLNDAQVPRLQALEAFNRAEGLIAEIDAILRDRQTEALLSLDPTPLNPVNWATALTGLGDLVAHLTDDMRARLSDPALRRSALESLGAIVLIAALGLAMILRGRAAMRAWVERLYARSQTRPGARALRYLVSLGQLALPVAGAVLVLFAVALTELAGDDLTDLVSAALILMLTIFTGVWLAARLFPMREGREAAFDLDPEPHQRAYRSIITIGTFMGLVSVAQTLTDFDQIAPAARGVFVLPLYLGLSYGFWRLASALMTVRTPDDAEGSTAFALRVTRFTARAVIVVAAAGPILAVIGYLNAAEAIMLPTAFTLGVLGVLVSLQPVIRDLYALIFRSTYEAASEALIPVLVNFMLVLGTIPIIALIWNVRGERLIDLYTRVMNGFTLGDVRITPGTVLSVVVVFALGLLATRLVQSALKTTVLPRTRMDTGARNAVTSGIGYVGIALASVIAVTAAGIDLTALGFVLGALSVGIGFGLQNVVSNFVSGIILLIERPISEGDWIEVGGNMGIVKSISVRSTRIETFDRTDVIVPNADFISGTVTNWTRGNTVGRAVVTVGVAYGTDTRRVERILHEVAADHPMVAKVPPPGVDFLGFGADSLDFRVRAILRDVNQLLDVKTEMHHRIAERFAQEGIEIPFAQRDVWLRNPETLTQATRPAAPAPITDDRADAAPDVDRDADGAPNTGS